LFCGLQGALSQACGRPLFQDFQVDESPELENDLQCELNKAGVGHGSSDAAEIAA
jgi:hypothetical protein